MPGGGGGLFDGLCGAVYWVGGAVTGDRVGRGCSSFSKLSVTCRLKISISSDPNGHATRRGDPVVFVSLSLGSIQVY